MVWFVLLFGFCLVTVRYLHPSHLPVVGAAEHYKRSKLQIVVIVFTRMVNCGKYSGIMILSTMTVKGGVKAFGSYIK